MATETEKYFRQVDCRAIDGFSEEEIATFVSLLDRMCKNLADASGSSDADERREKT